MIPRIPPVFICLLIQLGLASLSEAQQRVTPAQSRGGKLLDNPWATVPDGVRQTRFPNWAVPTDLDDWNRQRRATTRDIVLKCLGDLSVAEPDRKVARFASAASIIAAFAGTVRFGRSLDLE